MFPKTIEDQRIESSGEPNASSGASASSTSWPPGMAEGSVSIHTGLGAPANAAALNRNTRTFGGFTVLARLSFLQRLRCGERKCRTHRAVPSLFRCAEWTQRPTWILLRSPEPGLKARRRQARREHN